MDFFLNAGGSEKSPSTSPSLKEYSFSRIRLKYSSTSFFNAQVSMLAGVVQNDNPLDNSEFSAAVKKRGVLVFSIMHSSTLWP